MSEVLARWNGLPHEEAAREILPCCGRMKFGAASAKRIGWRRLRVIRESANHARKKLRQRNLRLGQNKSNTK